MTTPKFEILDLAEVLHDVPDTKIKAGMIGTVLERPCSAAYLVEFVDEVGDDHVLHWFRSDELGYYGVKIHRTTDD